MTDRLCHTSRSELFPPPPEDNDPGEAITEQTFRPAQRPEAGEVVAIVQALGFAHG